MKNYNTIINIISCVLAEGTKDIQLDYILEGMLIDLLANRNSSGETYVIKNLNNYINKKIDIKKILEREQLNFPKAWEYYKNTVKTFNF